MPGIFISYRREDSSAYAGRLFDILSDHFGREHTFMDLDTIRGGDDFEAVIAEKISQCDVLLAVIGDGWLTSAEENGSRRLDMAGDFVRLEIAKALERGVRVIPVLVGGATMPHQDDLPEDLRPLSVRQAMDLRDAHFHEDAEQLIHVLKANRPWKVESKRFAQAVSAVLAIAAVAGGVLLFRQARPAAHANPNSAASKQIAPANVPAPAAQGNPVEPDKSKNSPKPTGVAGKWKATVKYDWGDSYEETFNFEFFGPELSGTASLLTVGRGILDGKIDGDLVSFMTKSQSSSGDKTYTDKQYYKGTVKGDAIRFSMLIDSDFDSHVPIHFTATRLATK